MHGLILRFEAPLMSFGGVKVDQHNITDRFPGLSLFAGLIANALGWTHGDGPLIGELQDRLVTASRWDIEPELLVDYHTVDLGQPKMSAKGWTTTGLPEHRGKGPATTGTHLRFRHYLANGVLTSVLTLKDLILPDIDQIEQALRRPIRPLFLGRKTCLPSVPILMGRIEGPDTLSMLKAVPRAVRTSSPRTLPMFAHWPAEFGFDREDQLKTVYDLRDWTSQLHTGSRTVVEGLLQEEPDVHD